MTTEKEKIDPWDLVGWAVLGAIVGPGILLILVLLAGLVVNIT